MFIFTNVDANNEKMRSVRKIAVDEKLYRKKFQCEAASSNLPNKCTGVTGLPYKRIDRKVLRTLVSRT